MISDQLLLVICFAFLFVPSCNYDSSCDATSTCDKDMIKSPFLISVTETREVLQIDENHFPIYVCQPKDFLKGHIPNSLNIWRPDFRSQATDGIKGMRCSRKELERLLSELGVDSLSTLLIYDNKGSVDAFRFGWVLEYYGFEDFKIINGGLTSWQNAGFAISSNEPEKRNPTNFRIIGNPNPEILATLNDIQNAIVDPFTIIIDTRESYEYQGEPFFTNGEIFKYKKGAFDSGAIPTAVHLNWSVLSDLWGDHRIKCEKDLRYDLNNAGITANKNVIVYCQSGSRSSHSAFVLRHILDYPNVKNYDGSWIEWSYESVNNRSVEIDQKTDSITVNTILDSLKNANITN